MDTIGAGGGAAGAVPLNLCRGHGHGHSSYPGTAYFSGDRSTSAEVTAMDTTTRAHSRMLGRPLNLCRGHGHGHATASSSSAATSAAQPLPRSRPWTLTPEGWGGG